MPAVDCANITLQAAATQNARYSARMVARGLIRRLATRGFTEVHGKWQMAKGTSEETRHD